MTDPADYRFTWEPPTGIVLEPSRTEYIDRFGVVGFREKTVPETMLCRQSAQALAEVHGHDVTDLLAQLLP